MNSYIPLAADGLGTPVGEYRRSWIGALLGWGGGTAGMATALWFSYNSDTGTWWTALVFGLFSLMLLGATIWSTYTAATERVLLFSDGMFHQNALLVIGIAGWTSSAWNGVFRNKMAYIMLFFRLYYSMIKNVFLMDRSFVSHAVSHEQVYFNSFHSSKQ